MATMDKSKKIKRVAFILSICLCVLWGVLGTGASLAWFNDTSNDLKNIFHVAEFDLQVFHYNEDNDKWEELESNTEVFDKEALYEPGYTQTIFLKVVNNGNIPFDWYTAISAYDIVEGINVYGDKFNLQDYLMFGVVNDDDFTVLQSKVANRKLAAETATDKLGNYSSTPVELKEDESTYLALTVHMPEEVTNVANYKHPNQPEIYLNIIVYASQQQK